MDVSLTNKTKTTDKTQLLDRNSSLIKFKSLRMKILFGFGILIVMVLGLTVEGYFALHEMNDSIEHLAGNHVSIMIANERAAFSLARRSTNVRAYLMTGEERYREMFVENAEEN
jgi:methyl-accepting chemotaxis protein